LFLLFFINF